MSVSLTTAGHDAKFVCDFHVVGAQVSLQDRLVEVLILQHTVNGCQHDSCMLLLSTGDGLNLSIALILTWMKGLVII